MRLALVLFLGLTACDLGDGTGLPPAENPDFTLLVSNQSFAYDPADIVVLIDGRPAVEGDFLVEGQHSWHPFDFALWPGEHTLEALSAAGGGTSLTATFTVSDRMWGVLDFWFYPPSEGPLFTFTVHDTEPAFD